MADHCSRLVPYFGAKGTLGARIADELGTHRAYFEPCCGSMAVLGHKPESAMETVNDLNGDLINLARVIKDETLGPRLYRMCRRTLMHEEIFHECAARWKAAGRYEDDAPDMGRAYDYCISSWAGRNGVTGTASYNQGFSARYTQNGGHAATRFRLAVSSINWWRKRLANVTILRRDLFKLLDKIEDAEGVVVYMDPPYVVKGASYVHDFKGDDPHRELAARLARFTRTRVVVSYYDHPLVRELYAGWTLVDCAMNKALVNQGQRGKVSAVAPEVLLINGPSYTQEAGLFERLVEESEAVKC